MNPISKACVAEQERSTARDIIELAETAAAMSNDIMNRTEKKLNSVMRIEPPRCDDSKAEVASTIPPLFNALRDQLWAIQRNLFTISYYLDRTEL